MVVGNVMETSNNVNAFWQALSDVSAKMSHTFQICNVFWSRSALYPKCYASRVCQCWTIHEKDGKLFPNGGKLFETCLYLTHMLPTTRLLPALLM